ncbi:hypothetical protein [Paracoccus pacificus]|uniref:Uncharacterized protein n=1 Tax=Paracoccus pacificus TaxID=1463598 RepID=A0ABW4RBI8_9RHOB
MLDDLLSVANLSLVFGLLVAIVSGLQAVVVGLHDVWLRMKSLILPSRFPRLVLVPTHEEIAKYSTQTVCVSEQKERIEYELEEGLRWAQREAVQKQSLIRSNARITSMAYTFLLTFGVVFLHFLRLVVRG